MRFTPVVVVIALAGLSLATSLHSQPAGAPADPRSAALLARGKAAATAGDLNGATDLIETALAVDPNNRAAFLELARIAEKQQLTGKAIRLYRDALTIDPNDANALRGEGEAMVAKGAIGPAKENLAKLRQLCGKSACPEAASLEASIAKGPPTTGPKAAVVMVIPPPTPKETAAAK